MSKSIPLYKTNIRRPPTQHLIKALNIAKITLKRHTVDDSAGICWCLPRNTAGDYLCAYISDVLTPHCTWLYDWLDIHLPEYSQRPKSIREARLQWIDWMINSIQENESP